ncbi:hypothetical protein M911_06830 [Ectothiorhodospira haloalkaliphila]|uniref:Helix-turn-helix domain-containing protein n=1 Tax=Ectothiorhodospira haloalkaliphila TaxID=421628 RepID=W8L4T1_9GAMM|nr:hypothetical protein [Ectothiorhodospira haloalkaliphila]AHK78915.1 hypothetical protein M911_06830 [Ectothiorhodospira haloalkaliphila]MCG5525929.1 hypothetical protein [Ectothiorhodospira haloalkaliphila]
MTYLTTEELAKRLSYNPRYINNVLRPKHLDEGRHYVRPFGGRKVLYIWENIEQDMFCDQPVGIPMANGGVCNG